MSFLTLENVSKQYGPRSILSGINLAVEEGEFISVVGSSACGKTTLVKLASGLLLPTAGSVRLAGQPVLDFSPEAAIVFQNYSLLPWLSALENVRLAVASAFPRYTPKQVDQQAEKYLHLVGLGKALAKKPSQLSGGMRQRVAIARAFAVQPRLLFLDEPFGALDALTRATLQQELAKLCSAAERPVTALMITNSVEEAILLSDRILALGQGPGASLSAPLAVNIARPRSAADSLNQEAVVALRNTLAEYLLAGRKAAPAKKTPEQTPLSERILEVRA